MCTAQLWKSPWMHLILTAFILAAIPVQGHLRMSKPPSLGGRDNPLYFDEGQGSPAIDYGIANPIENMGLYPCRGHHKDVPSVVQASETIAAGSQYSITLSNREGTDHGGGSCQISLSYDGGTSFGVIHSFIGGCPLAPNDGDTDTLTFQIPEATPSGTNILLAWNWITRTGLMELYMNCAAVNIESSSTSMTVPALVRANIGGTNCKVAWDNELVYPNPGDPAFVTYGGTWAGQTPTFDKAVAAGCSDDELGMSTVTLQSNGQTSIKPVASDTAPESSGTSDVPVPPEATLADPSPPQSPPAESPMDPPQYTPTLEEQTTSVVPTSSAVSVSETAPVQTSEVYEETPVVRPPQASSAASDIDPDLQGFPSVHVPPAACKTNGGRRGGGRGKGRGGRGSHRGSRGHRYHGQHEQ